MKMLGRLFVVLLVILVLTQFALPKAAEQGLEHALKASYPGIDSVNVDLEAFPALKLLAGKADKLNIDAENYPIGKLTAQSFTAQLSKVSLDMAKLLSDKKVHLNAVEKTVSLVLTEDMLNQYLESNFENSILAQPNLSIGDRGIKLQGVITVVGQEINAAVQGSLVLDSGQLWFKPNKVVINGAEYAPTIQKRLLSRVGFKVTIRNMPIQIKFNKVRQIRGKLLLEAKTS